MQNIIVTHKSVDLDAVTSCWLIKRFYPNFKNARIFHVDAGHTYMEQVVDSNAHIIHVDTGFGRFDHHQTDEFTCASKKIFLWLINNVELKIHIQDGLSRMVEFVTQIDHFQEVFFPEPTNDMYEFNMFQIVEGLKHTTGSDEKAIEISFVLLDTVLQLMTNKIRAEEEIKKGYIFESSFGKSLALECKNEESVKLAQKSGFMLVVRKDPVKGHIRIKVFPKKELDLTKVYEKIIAKDKVGSWFLHVSKKMLLNGSSKNPSLKPTQLTIQEVISIIQSV